MHDHANSIFLSTIFSFEIPTCIKSEIMKISSMSTIPCGIPNNSITGLNILIHIAYHF